MPTYKEVIESVSPESALILKNFLNEGVIKERQVIPIIEKSLRTDKNRGAHVITQEDVNRLIDLLKWIKHLELHTKNKKSYDDTIKRLNSANGNETFNEFCAHGIMLSLFPSYAVCMPLYGQGADGVIKIANDEYIPVEIKSRFPEKYEIIREFCEVFNTIISDVANEFDIYCQVNFKQIKGLTFEASSKETEELKKLITNTDFNRIPHLPETVLVERNLDGYEYQILLGVSKADPSRNGFGVSEEFIKRLDEVGTIYFAIGAQYIGDNSFGGVRQVHGLVSDAAQSELARLVVTQCIKSAKNLPDEPRVIVIYTPYGLESKNFIVSTVEKYIENHDKTMVIIASSVFDKTMVMKFRIIHSKHGKGLNDFVSKYSVIPKQI